MFTCGNVRALMKGTAKFAEKWSIQSCWNFKRTRRFTMALTVLRKRICALVHASFITIILIRMSTENQECHEKHCCYPWVSHFFFFFLVFGCWSQVKKTNKRQRTVYNQVESWGGFYRFFFLFVGSFLCFI